MHSTDFLTVTLAMFLGMGMVMGQCAAQEPTDELPVVILLGDSIRINGRAVDEARG